VLAELDGDDELLVPCGFHGLNGLYVSAAFGLLPNVLYDDSDFELGCDADRDGDELSCPELEKDELDPCEILAVEGLDESREVGRLLLLVAEVALPRLEDDGDDDDDVLYEAVFEASLLVLDGDGSLAPERDDSKFAGEDGGAPAVPALSSYREYARLREGGLLLDGAAAAVGAAARGVCAGLAPRDDSLLESSRFHDVEGCRDDDGAVVVVAVGDVLEVDGVVVAGAAGDGATVDFRSNREYAELRDGGSDGDADAPERPSSYSSSS
jgi:hypothetical protein